MVVDSGRGGWPAVGQYPLHSGCLSVAGASNKSHVVWAVVRFSEIVKQNSHYRCLYYSKAQSADPLLLSPAFFLVQ